MAFLLYLFFILIKKMIPAIGRRNIKEAESFDIRRKQMLVTAVNRIPSQILKLNAIPVYLTLVGKVLLKVKVVLRLEYYKER